MNNKLKSFSSLKVCLSNEHAQITIICLFKILIKTCALSTVIHSSPLKGNMARAHFQYAQFLFLVLFVWHGEMASALTVLDTSGKAAKKSCKEKAEEYTNKKDKYCAVLFENDECSSGFSLLGVSTGWDKGIKEGKETFSRLGRYREDSESVIVAPGCIFIGYDESDEDDDNKRTIANAIGKRHWVYKEFKVCVELASCLSVCHFPLFI